MVLQFVYCEIIRWAWRRDANKLAGLESRTQNLLLAKDAEIEVGVDRVLEATAEIANITEDLKNSREMYWDLDKMHEGIMDQKSDIQRERNAAWDKLREVEDEREAERIKAREDMGVQVGRNLDLRRKLRELENAPQELLDEALALIEDLRAKNSELIRHFDLESDVYYLPRNIDGSVHRNTQNKLSRLWLERLAFEGNHFAVELITRVRSGQTPQTGIFINKTEASN